MSATVDRAPSMVRRGRWGFWQEIDGEWESTGSLGFDLLADAEAELRRLHTIQPGRFRLRDRRPAESDADRKDTQEEAA